MTKLSRRRCLAMLALGLGMILANTTSAKATLQLQLSGSDGSSATAVDSSGSGAVFYNGFVTGSNQFRASFTTGTSNSPGGDTYPGAASGTAQLQIVSMNVSSTAAGTLTIILNDNGFMTPGNGPGLYLTSNVRTNSGSDPSLGVSFTFQSFADAGNHNDFNPQGTTPGTQGPFAYPMTNVNNTATTGFTRTSSPFSLYQKIVITFTQRGSVGITATTNVFAPEPATLAMAFAGLPVMGLGLWRRRKAWA